MTVQSLTRNWDQIFTNVYLTYLTKYVVIAGLAFLCFYVIWHRFFSHRRIQKKPPAASDLRREITYSLCSIGIFAATGILVVVLNRLGLTQMYGKIEAYGWPYFWFSVVALILIHDTWFYWSHRFMHWGPVYRRVHKVHHMSHNPTPWAAFSFHPIEAFIEALIFPLTILVLPVSGLAASLWALYMTVMNVTGHLGFEVLPRGFVRHRLFRWHNTSVHHNMHHRYFNCNYGLYFNMWDRWMGTNHRDYEATYDRVTNGGREPAHEHEGSNESLAAEGAETVPLETETKTPATG